MYELGALRALDEAVEGLDLTRLEVYVGVSSGAFLAASLANRMDTATMCRIFLTGDSGDVRFRPETFLRPAFFEYARRVMGLPGLLLDFWRTALTHPTEVGVGDLIGRFGGLIPNGLFDNSGIEEFLREAFTRRGRSNDFRELKRKLRVISVDLDSGETVRFGAEDWDDVPISVAVQASSALPGLYPPVKLHGRHLVDGALRRTMHGSVALDEDIDLLIGLNPLVPYDGHSKNAAAHDRVSSVTSGGLPMVLSQTFRTLLQSRMQVGLAKYAQQYAHSDQLILEPDHDDAEVFFTNAFSYSSRRRVSEHAYRATLLDLGRQREVLRPMLGRLGLRLRDELLDAPGASLMEGVRREYRPHTGTTARLARALDDVEELLEERATPSPKQGRRAPR